MNSDMKAMIYEEYGSPEVEKPKKTNLLANLFAAEWLIPVGLIMLSAIPLITGALHMVELATGAEIIPNYERPSVSPLPAILHVISVTLYSILGAFQFVPGFRRRRPGWHRIAGRILVPCGLIAALSGLWMTQFYPLPEGDGTLLYGLRLLFGSAMLLSIVLAVAAIQRRDIVEHGAWMIRAYAIGLGAGTQVLTLLLGALIFGTPGEFPRALLMGAGWVINLAVAEWLIRKRLGHPTGTSKAAVSSLL